MKSGQKIDLGLTGYDELFMTDQERAENKLPRIYDIPLSEIDPFPDHPFQVRMDEDMQLLVESIKERGLITPITLRKKDDGRYEIVSGHRRTKACEIAGLGTVKAEIREMTRDEAIILMVDSNCQRTTILPSEKAKSYKMKLEAIKRLPGRPSKDNSAPVEQNFGGKTSREIIRSKNTADNLMDDGQVSPSEYAEDQTRYAVEDVASDVGHAVKKETDKAVEKGREAFREHQREKRIEKQEQRADEALHRFYEETQVAQSAPTTPPNQSVYQHTARMQRGAQMRNTTIKTAEQTERTIKQTAKSTGKATIKTAETSVKATEKTIKTAEATSKAAVKTAEATAKAAEKAAETAAKTAQKMAEMARQAAIAAYKAAVAVGKAVAAAVKAIIAAVKELIAAIAAGGWVAVVVIVVICLIALIAGSCFGIFFSSEDKNDGSQTLREVVVEINQDYQDRLDSIKANNPYDSLEMSGSRAVWPEVLSVYAVKTTTDPDNPQEVATLNDEKKQLLTDIFWEMNDISYRTETDTETEIIESDDGHGNILEETVEVTKTTLYITVSHKTADEMADHYRFNDDQDSQLEELLSVDNSMWLAVLYGVYGSDDMIVQVALSQIGNVGGEPYWSWYGFGSRVEWCACFVSWCADQCGYIETGVCPKYAGCVNGVAWFKEHDQWLDGSATPSPGMIIFYDWDSPNGESGPQDGLSDHTGIVEKVENGIVYTVEGNSGDACRQRQHAVGYYEILGYGVLIP